MTRSTGRKPRPTPNSSQVFTHLVCAIARAMHDRAAFTGPGEWVIRTNRAELEALRFSAECARQFADKG